MTRQQYICAFNRDRDSYQIPLSLAEKGKLEKFITDYYFNPRIKVRALQHRYIEGIPSELTSLTLKALAIQGSWKVATKILPNFELPEVSVDGSISNHVRRFTRTSESNLFLYSNFARTFGDPWNKKKLRILFQFHPAPRFIESLMRDIDLPAKAMEPEVRYFDKLVKLSDIELSNSHHIVCASSFTKKSLVFSGYPAKNISIIPYGCPSSKIRIRKDKSGPLRYVFLGSAVRRKGLDLLLKAWSSFHSQTGSELYVISRVRDTTIDFVENPGVIYSDGLSSTDLEKFLCEMDALVLPSLVEGFGLVITEALSAGLHVIASENTGLLDLNLSSKVGTLISGDVNHHSILQGLSKSASTICENRQEIASLAQKYASENSWAIYRSKLSHLIGAVERGYFEG